MKNILYQVGDGLYINLTNRCSCACTFCIRVDHEGIGDAETLWLSREPEAEEVISLLKDRDLSQYSEAVFCGYGEPTERLDVLLAVSRWLKENSGLAVRLNTNGLASLVNGVDVPPMLRGLLDTVSVSLNAPDAKRYVEVTRPVFGEEAFEAMLAFARACREYIPKVQFTVVDILTPEEVEESRRLAEAEGIPLRVRVKA